MSQKSSQEEEKKVAPHILLFPFMSKGHTIPLLHLAQLLLNRGAAVTIVTTSGNHPFISRSLSGSPHLSVVLLPFPKSIAAGIPEDADSTDKLPSMSLFVPFVAALKLMQPSFDDLLHNIHSHITCIVSDSFLPWTLESASRFGIPRLSYHGMGYYAAVVAREAAVSGSLLLHESGDQPFTLAKFPWITLTRNDFDHPFNERDPRGPHMDLIKESILATEGSAGLVMNSFEELESPYIKYFHEQRRPKAWSIGPLCLTKLHNKNENRNNSDRPEWMHWLDQRCSPVLYVAFGSQAKHSQTQFLEIARALEEAQVSFLWVVKQREAELLSKGYEERVGERGCIVTEWVDQEEILEHPITFGFLSHCGWNSVLEAISGEVSILAWPMMAEQHMNAKVVVEEIKIGIRVATVDGSARGFVSADSLRNTMAELMEGAEGEQLRKRVKEVAEAARRAVAEGGSSWLALEGFIDEMKLCREKSLVAAPTFSLKIN